MKEASVVGGDISEARSTGGDTSDSGSTDTDLSEVTDTTGYYSEEETTDIMFSVVNPMIVVSNRLPFVLKRDKSGELKRQPR